MSSKCETRELYEIPSPPETGPSISEKIQKVRTHVIELLNTDIFVAILKKTQNAVVSDRQQYRKHGFTTEPVQLPGSPSDDPQAAYVHQHTAGGARSWALYIGPSSEKTAPTSEQEPYLTVTAPLGHDRQRYGLTYPHEHNPPRTELAYLEVAAAAIECIKQFYKTKQEEGV